MTSSFDELGLGATQVRVLHELGLERPTPIQAACIPPLLAGDDLIGQSQTGSGKTAAFALPLLHRVELGRKAVQALVLCPTRELSAQVARELRQLGRGHGRGAAGVFVLELVGGQPARPQRESLARGVHLAVGTPGRVLAHLESGALDVGALKTVVLDEADRMLDMGFGEEVGAILRALPPERQTALFSATFPEGPLRGLSDRHQREAVRVQVDDDDRPPVVIEQFRVTAGREREHALAWVLRHHEHESALVFCNFKASVQGLVETLSRAGVSADRLDGDLEQFERDQVLARFRNKSLRVLVATDVAGRGIDVDGLDLVVNYELPAQVELYLHRIGRTGRAGRPGLAISLDSGRGDPRMRAIEAEAGAAIAVLARDAYPDPGQKQLLRELAAPAPMGTILISGGRRDRVRPGDIVGALTGEAGGLRFEDLGRIEVQERIAYVAVVRRHARQAAAALNRGRIKGKRFRATLVGGAD